MKDVYVTFIKRAKGVMFKYTLQSSPDKLQSSPVFGTLEIAIKEFEKIVKLDRK